jgi:hypothetical protein
MSKTQGICFGKNEDHDGMARDHGNLNSDERPSLPWSSMLQRALIGLPPGISWQEVAPRYDRSAGARSHPAFDARLGPLRCTSLGFQSL